MKTEIVLFKDKLEDNDLTHYGILINDNEIICLCCGGVLEKDDYEILEHLSYEYLEETLKQYW